MTELTATIIGSLAILGGLGILLSISYFFARHAHGTRRGHTTCHWHELTFWDRSVNTFISFLVFVLICVCTLLVIIGGHQLSFKLGLWS
jgi:hypothetical protein